METNAERTAQVMNEDIFSRETLLVGAEVMTAIAAKKVIIFGVGGVGSWCAESLVRSGIKHLTIVDSDVVCITNVNRQLMATTKTIGRAKVDVLKDRLLDINPLAQINAIQGIYSEETSATFNLSSYDCIIDAIDSLKDKENLILEATKTDAILYSSMGAALKMDATKIQVAEFWKVKGCPLAKALRQKFKKSKDFPSKKFKCVYSEELLENKGTDTFHETSTPLAENDWHTKKVHTNGTIAHTTAIFGFMLAGLVIQDIVQKEIQ